MRKVCPVFYLILFLAFVPGCRSENLDEVFANTTYMIGNEYFSQRAPLVDGKHEEPYLYVYYEHKFVCGDFNNDGLEDAAVIIAESGGGSGHYRFLAFLINDGTEFVHRASHYLGDKAIINSLKEERGRVFVDMLVRDESTWAEGILKRVKTIYEYSGPEAWESRARP